MKGKKAKESYPPVSTWAKAPDSYRSLKINDGEYRVVPDPRTGAGDYVVAQMQAFRSGERVHNMMAPVATRLTDQQIDDVANYIQGLR